VEYGGSATNLTYYGMASAGSGLLTGTTLA